jgi:hypothetical protein
MDARRAIIVGLLAGALALAPSIAAAAEANPPYDAWLTTKAKLAVLTNTGTAGTNVNVDTVRGTVTLHGTVSSEEDKAKAEKSAKEIDGVKEVRNLLKVVPGKQAKEVSANDAKVKEAVQKALKKESSLAGSGSPSSRSMTGRCCSPARPRMRSRISRPSRWHATCRVS